MIGVVALTGRIERHVHVFIDKRRAGEIRRRAERYIRAPTGRARACTVDRERRALRARHDRIDGEAVLGGRIVPVVVGSRLALAVVDFEGRAGAENEPARTCEFADRLRDLAAERHRAAGVNLEIVGLAEGAARRERYRSTVLNVGRAEVDVGLIGYGDFAFDKDDVALPGNTG